MRKNFIFNFLVLSILSLPLSTLSAKPALILETSAEEEEFAKLEREIFFLNDSNRKGDSYKMAVYALSGTAVSAGLASSMGWMEGKGPWLCSFVVGAALGTLCYLAHDSTSRWVLRRVRILRELTNIFRAENENQTSDELFESLLTKSAQTFFNLISSGRMISSLDSYFYFQFLEQVLSYYEKHPELDLAPLRQLSQSLEVFRPSSLKLKRQLSQLKFQAYGFVGSQLRKTNPHELRIFSNEIDLSLKKLRRIIDLYQASWNIFKNFGSADIEIFEISDTETQVLSFENINEQPVRFRVGLKKDWMHLQAEDLRKLLQKPLEFSQIFGAGSWVRYPELGQTTWNYFRERDPLPYSNKHDLGPIQILESPFYSTRIQYVDLQPRPRNLLESRRSKANNQLRSQLSSARAICISLISGLHR